MSSLVGAFFSNLSFVAVCLVVVAACGAVSVIVERVARKRSGAVTVPSRDLRSPQVACEGAEAAAPGVTVPPMTEQLRGVEERILSTRRVVVIGAFSAISTILFCFDFPVFFAPGFYKMDFSELPALIAGFAFGPVSAILIEFIKILVKLCIKGTSTAFVGELANFVVGASFLLPATILYLFRKTRGMALLACVVGTVSMTVFGAVFNALYLLPAFSKLYGMPLDQIIEMGSKVNASITDVRSFVILAVAPLNLLKGGLDSLITVLIYKKLSPILKA